MKTTTILAAGSLLLGALLAPLDASAGVMDGLGTWEGTGTTTSVGGAALGTFTVSVTRKAVGNGTVRSDGTVLLANGQTIVFWQEMVDAGANGYRITSSSGTGGGRCFASGMCQSYEQQSDGHAFATTMARDSSDRVRMLITELDKGQAVRFMDQTLTKKP